MKALALIVFFMCALPGHAQEKPDIAYPLQAKVMNFQLSAGPTTYAFVLGQALPIQSTSFQMNVIIGDTDYLLMGAGKEARWFKAGITYNAKHWKSNGFELQYIDDKGKVKSAKFGIVGGQSYKQ